MKLNNNSKKQSGAVLIVSMVILVALTMLGVTSMKGALTELTMAGNLRESGLTFQASEAGLVFAEKFIESSTSTTTFNGNSTSLLGKTDSAPNYLTKSSWNTAKSANVTLANISNKPKYIIHYLGERDTNKNASTQIGGYGRDRSGKEISNFRVTSRGSGQTDNHFRVVQSYYGKEY